MPKNESESDLIEKARNAYRDAEVEMRTYEKIREEREKEEEIFKTAWESVKLGQDENTFIE